MAFLKTCTKCGVYRPEGLYTHRHGPMLCMRCMLEVHGDKVDHCGCGKLRKIGQKECADCVLGIPSGLFAGNPPKSVNFGESHQGIPLWQQSPKSLIPEVLKEADRMRDPDRYRREAEACARDDIHVTVEHRSLYAFFHLSGVRLEIFASVPENLEELPGVASELVNRVHRLRELLRQAGEAI